MIKQPARNLLDSIKQALNILTIEQGRDIAETIQPLVMENLERQRIQGYLERHRGATYQDYVWHVADCYRHLQTYIHQIQIEKDAKLWRQLLDKMERWATQYLRNKLLPAEDNYSQHVQTCVHEASSILVGAYFPYDVEFDPWMCVLVRNVCHKYVARTSRIRLTCIAWEEWPDWLENIADDKSIHIKQQIELRLDLLNAIEQLATKSRQIFIILYYFEHKSYQQIAEIMNKRINALYKLHFDALENLRKILDPDFCS